MNCRLPMRIGKAGGGGDSGGGASEYAVTMSGDMNANYAYVTINGTKYRTAQTVSVAAGTKITVFCSGQSGYQSSATLYLNGTLTVHGQASGITYELTVNSNCTIAFETVQNLYYRARITTEDSGGGGGGSTTKEYVVNITGTGNSTYCHVTVNGTKYTSAKTVTVTEGTQISCYVKTQSGTAGNVWVGINLNGSWVLEATGTYKHTVNANCTVDLRHTTPTDHIYITTE